MEDTEYYLKKLEERYGSCINEEELVVNFNCDPYHWLSDMFGIEMFNESEEINNVYDLVTIWLRSKFNEDFMVYIIRDGKELRSEHWFEYGELWSDIYSNGECYCGECGNCVGDREQFMMSQLERHNEDYSDIDYMVDEDYFETENDY